MALPLHPLPELQWLNKAGKSVGNRTDASHLSRNLLQCLKAAGNIWWETSNVGAEMQNTQ